MTDVYIVRAPDVPPVGTAVLLRVFVDRTQSLVGGNPVSLVLDAREMAASYMQNLAAHYGHESSFVVPADSPDHLCRLRFFVPGHEMKRAATLRWVRCGHCGNGDTGRRLARACRLSVSAWRLNGTTFAIGRGSRNRP